MIFSHPNIIKKSGKFTFSGNVNAKASKIFDKDILKDFWHGFTFKSSKIEFSITDSLIFKLGNVPTPELAGASYAINVTKDGITIVGENEKSLVNGYVTMLEFIKMSDCGQDLEIDCFELRESPLIEHRMVHYCVFAQTKLWEIERFIKLCGALKISHIVIEFWGMLKYDYLKELAWAHAFSKDEIKPLIKMANDLGIEIIPMLNHWGHASSCRMIHGKHVVLNQNPTLQYFFNESGWCWNITNPKTKDLLRLMRQELIELCGDGEYFHVGCDEAYGFDFSKESMDNICDYLNKITGELISIGRRPIMWGDMLLYKHDEYMEDTVYYTSCPSLECEEYMISKLDKHIVMADWQYEVKKAPVETALSLTKAGFDTLLSPYDMGNALAVCAKTVREQKLFGLMHTTWHTLSMGMSHVARAAVHAWEDTPDQGIHFWSLLRTKLAALLRRAYFTDGDYEKSGWADYEINVII